MPKLLTRVVLVLIVALSLSQQHQAVARAERPVKVEVFVTSWCTFCNALEQYLKDAGIRYTRHDIEKDARSKKLYSSLGLRGVPITKVGSDIIRGYNPWAIERAIEHARRGSPLQGS